MPIRPVKPSDTQWLRRLWPLCAFKPARHSRCWIVVGTRLFGLASFYHEDRLKVLRAADASRHKRLRNWRTRDAVG